MKKAKDINIKAAATMARAEATTPTPATTPEVIGHYRRHFQLNHAKTDPLITPTFAIYGLMAIDARFVRIRRPVINPNNV